MSNTKSDTDYFIYMCGEKDKFKPTIKGWMCTQKDHVVRMLKGNRIKKIDKKFCFNKYVLFNFKQNIKKNIRDNQDNQDNSDNQENIEPIMCRSESSFIIKTKKDMTNYLLVKIDDNNNPIPIKDDSFIKKI